MDFGSLRRVKPISRHWGFERGQPVDRYYVEDFLSHHADDIRGHVLEIGDNSYTLKFGGTKVTRSDVLHIRNGSPGATIIADLAHADDIESNTFDCIIFTQTLQFIYDVRVTLATLNRILRNGGVLLSTFPGISQIARREADRWGDYWRFTTFSARKLFCENFREGSVEVGAHGNALAAIAFLHGLAAQELTKEELEYNDPNYEVTIWVRAVK